MSLVAVASASASFAGPGLQYWNARRADRARAAEKPAATAPTGAKCESMIVKQGKRTSTVTCTGSITETAKCKAACGS